MGSGVCQAAGSEGPEVRGSMTSLPMTTTSFTSLQLRLTKGLLCDRPWIKFFTCIMSVNLQDAMREVLTRAQAVNVQPLLLQSIPEVP